MNRYFTFAIALMLVFACHKKEFIFTVDGPHFNDIQHGWAVNSLGYIYSHNQ
jgi:hypothetical protein